MGPEIKTWYLRWALSCPRRLRRASVENSLNRSIRETGNEMICESGNEMGLTSGNEISIQKTVNGQDTGVKMWRDAQQPHKVKITYADIVKGV